MLVVARLAAAGLLLLLVAQQTIRLQIRVRFLLQVGWRRRVAVPLVRQVRGGRVFLLGRSIPRPDHGYVGRLRG